MSETQNETGQSSSLRQKIVRLRRIAAFILLASEDRRRVATLFSNTHIFFEKEWDKQREYAAVNRDFLWWWCVRNAAKQFVKKRVAKWQNNQTINNENYGAKQMSKYMSFETEAFADRELLVSALQEMGFEKIEQGTDLLLDGYDKRDQRTADIVIRKREVTAHRLLSDIGFQKTAKGYVAVLDDMDLDYHLGRDFIRRLQTNYHEQTAQKMAKNLGGTLLKERIGKTIKIGVRY